MKRLARALAVALIGPASAACSSASIEVAGTAADPAAPSPPVSPGSGVLREGFDPLTLAPRAEATDAPAGPGHYTCPHHPEVREAAPGDCPKCGMPLRFVADPPQAAAPGAHDHGARDHGAHDHGAEGGAR